MIAAPPRRRYTRSTCHYCQNGAKHTHCRSCGAIVINGKRLCGICAWEGPRARTNHSLLEPLIFLLQEIFNPS